ncbi:MAG: hypothetical protein IPG32_07560 [Saprospirales bacterium]|nr:hypothetical protein [Saprospirales bacterium]
MPYGDLLWDLSKLRLLGIYKDKGNALMQLLRFLRLANKLDWPYRALDMFCTAYGIQSEAIPRERHLYDFTNQRGDAFLTNLGYFQRMKLKLDKSPEQPLAFYRNINSIRYTGLFRQQARQVFSLYESLFLTKRLAQGRRRW